MTSSTRHFIRHYLEMVAAMFAGMFVLGGAALLPLAAAGVGYGDLESDAPAVLLLGMGITMTIPMVAWMRHRGHGWRPSAEMAAAMLIPTAGVIALLATGLGGVHDLLMIEHFVMLPAMLVAMLLRREEYSHGHGRRGHSVSGAVV